MLDHASLTNQLPPNLLHLYQPHLAPWNPAYNLPLLSRAFRQTTTLHHIPDFVDLCLQSQSIDDISKVHTLEVTCICERGASVLSRLLKKLGLTLKNLNLELAESR